jgi:hypothetical protein
LNSRTSQDAASFEIPGVSVKWSLRSHAMPIRPFLNGHQFDQEMQRVLGVAFELVCIALHTGDCDDHVKQAIADKIIALAKAGERNPDLLCEHVLKGIRQPRV